MAFFDNFSKKASEVAAKTVQKTQEFAETSKLNSRVTEEEKKIDGYYYQIGKLYVSLHPTDCEAELAELVQSVRESEEKIEALKKNIQDIRGVQRCEKCGAEVARDAGFCSTCGAPLPKPEPVAEEAGEKCDKCGAAIDKDMRFCMACGNPVNRDQESAPTQEEPPAQEQ